MTILFSYAPCFRLWLSSWPALVCPQQQCNSWASLPFSPCFWGTYSPRLSKRQQTKVYLFWFGWWQHWSPSQQHMDTGHGWEDTNATLHGPRASPWHTESMGNLEQEGRHAHNTTWHDCRGHGDRGTHHTYRVIASLELPFWGKCQQFDKLQSKNRIQLGVYIWKHR